MRYNGPGATEVATDSIQRGDRKINNKEQRAPDCGKLAPSTVGQKDQTEREDPAVQNNIERPS